MRIEEDLEAERGKMEGYFEKDKTLVREENWA